MDRRPRLLLVDLEEQLVPGSFAHALAMLLKAALLGYPQGRISSRVIARGCRDNLLFICHLHRNVGMRFSGNATCNCWFDSNIPWNNSNVGLYFVGCLRRSTPCTAPRMQRQM